MYKTLPLCLVFFLSISGAIIASKANAETNSFSIEEAVFRPGVGNRPGVMFFKLSNTSGMNKTLISATRHTAEKIEIHNHDMKDGVMRLRRLVKLSLNVQLSI